MKMIKSEQGVLENHLGELLAESNAVVVVIVVFNSLEER
jgi:hypothetical protein